MLNFEQAKEEIKKGHTLTRLTWVCKVIRKWRESDADFFVNEFKDQENSIIQECHKPCDCVVGIYIEEEGDRIGEDWVVLH
jgi:hypothetical protein